MRVARRWPIHVCRGRHNGDCRAAGRIGTRHWRVLIIDSERGGCNRGPACRVAPPLLPRPAGTGRLLTVVCRGERGCLGRDIAPLPFLRNASGSGGMAGRVLDVKRTGQGDRQRCCAVYARATAWLLCSLLGLGTACRTLAQENASLSPRHGAILMPERPLPADAGRQLAPPEGAGLAVVQPLQSSQRAGAIALPGHLLEAAAQGGANEASAGRLAAGTGAALMQDWPRSDSGEPARLPEPVMSRLAVSALLQTGLPADGFGLVVQPLGEGRLRVDHQGERAFNPASTMKLVTTHAALSILGPDYRWATRFHVRGALKDGVLHGDLVIEGGGDPRLLIEDLRALMAELRAAGLHTIRGNLLIDDSRFAAAATAVGAFDGDSSQAYNVLPYAALLNFKATRLLVDPKKRRLTADPPLADVQLRYAVRTLKGRCRATREGLGVHESTGRNGRPVITVRGALVRACGTQGFYAAVLDHQRFVHGIFKAAWQESGGRFLGRTLIRAGAARRARPLLTWSSSRDLAGVVHDINKFSNNVMTRMVLLELAAAAGRGAVKPAEAGRWLHGWYRGQGLALSSLVIENGSGLSRQARISARDMVAVLRHAAAARTANWFEASLPVVGIDGTMRTRLRRDPVAGQARIKTGTLSGVRAIAGYVTAASGERYAVSLMINGRFDVRQALRGQDELLRWVYRNG